MAMEDVVDRLRSMDIQEDVLLEMRRKLNDATETEVANINWRLLLEVFLEKAEKVSTNDEHMCGEVFTKLLHLISTEDLVNVHQLSVLKALAHPKAEIQNRILDEVKERCEREWDAVSGVLLGKGEAVLVGIARLIGTRESNVADKAAHLIVLLSHDLRFTLRQPLVQKELYTYLKADSTVRFRFYEMVGAGCEKSEEFQTAAAELGWLAALVAELDKDDILVQLNALEILGGMAAGAPHCASFLHKSNVSPRLNQMLVNTKEHPEGGFLFPAILRFFGYMAHQHPDETCRLYPEFLKCVWQSVFNWKELEHAQRLLAFDTLALLASSSNGRAFLATHHGHMKKALECFGEAASRGPAEIRERHLQALCNVFRAHPNMATKEDSSMLEEWWGQVFPPNSSERMVSLFRQPLLALHIASGELIAAVAEHPWGLLQLLAVPGFVEYLLNRSTESEMNGRYIKYDIVGTMIESAANSHNVDPPVLLKLKEFHRQGPYYVKINTEVALESGE